MHIDPHFVEQSQADAQPIVRLSEFLRSPPGRYVLEWERQRLNAAVADIFGYHALQLGLPEIDALRENRMPLRFCAADRLLDVTTANGARSAAACREGDAAGGPAGAGRTTRQPAEHATGDATGDATGHATGHTAERTAGHAAAQTALHTTGHTQVAVINRYEELPFASQSIDLVVMPHILEFAEEPHQVLREVDRVLVPEGHVVLTGFNPASLWGLRQVLARVGASPFLPREGQFIGLPRIKDWLKLLSFEVSRGRFGCYVPWARSDKWLTRWAFTEKVGDRWWPVLGSVYMVTAVKRVRGMRLVGLIRKRTEALRPTLAPAASRALHGNGKAFSVDVDPQSAEAANERWRAAVARRARDR